MSGLAAHGEIPCRTESGAKPVCQGETREPIGHFRPRRNVVQPGFSATRMPWGVCHGLLGRRLVLWGACVGLAVSVSAQPDPRQMSGIPRPDPNLSDGTVTVRVIRGSFANNVVGHQVELRAGDRASTADTDGEGRATFFTLNPGEQVRVATTLDGEELESLGFAAPGLGGVAVMLVGAGDPGDGPPVVAATPGQVSLAQESRILVELGEETIEVYYLLDVLNLADGPVTPDPPFEFSLPAGAQSPTVLQGSTPRTLVDGSRVWVQGDFASGVTPVRVAYILPYSTGSIALSQAFPAAFDQLLVFVEKWGSMDVASAQIDRRGEMGPDATGGSTLIWGAGRRVPANEPVSLELNGLPHHAGWPRVVALGLSALIIAVSGWVSTGGQIEDTASVRFGTLQSRREKLFVELVKIERQNRLGKIGTTRYRTRRRQLIDQLQRVLQGLDEGLAPPVVGPSGVLAQQASA